MIGGTPRWTGLSTNASCQPEKPENSQMKTWGSASTLGLACTTVEPLFQPERTRDPRKPAECCGYWRRKAKPLLSRERARGVMSGKVWLPRKCGFQLPLRPLRPDQGLNSRPSTSDFGTLNRPSSAFCFGPPGNERVLSFERSPNRRDDAVEHQSLQSVPRHHLSTTGPCEI
jgi:hypothetical protein